MGYHGLLWASKGYVSVDLAGPVEWQVVLRRYQKATGTACNAYVITNKSRFVLEVSWRCQAACKPGSVPARAALRRRDDERPFLWDTPCDVPHATNPGDGAGMPLRPPFPVSPAAPIRSCSRWGLPCRPCCQARGALLPPRFTLAWAACANQAVCFLWHFPWGHPRRPLAGTAFPWSPDFPPPPPSPKAAAAVQPPDPAGLRASCRCVNAISSV